MGTYPGQYPYRFAEFEFPIDEGRHDLTQGALSPLEWWYVVSHLDGDDGHRYFVFLCWFSSRSLQVAITDLTTGQRWTHAQRYGPGEVQIESGRMKLDFAGNVLENSEPFAYRSRVAGPETAIALDYYAKRIPFPVGEEGGRPGFFHFPDGGYTWYYTQSRLQTTGVLTLDLASGGKKIRVRGLSWLDRQWGMFLPVGTWRWEWMAIRVDLARGDYPVVGPLDYNAWNVRDARTGSLLWNMATVLYPDNSVRVGTARMDALARWTSPQGYTYSHGWKVSLSVCKTPALKLRVTPVVADQTQPMASRLGVNLPERRPEFWEGACDVYLDKLGGRRVGSATVELTQHYNRA